MPTSGCGGQTPAGAGGSAAAPLKGVTGDDRGEKKKKIKAFPNQWSYAKSGGEARTAPFVHNCPGTTSSRAGWLLARSSHGQQGQERLIQGRRGHGPLTLRPRALVRRGEEGEEATGAKGSSHVPVCPSTAVCPPPPPQRAPRASAFPAANPARGSF